MYAEFKNTTRKWSAAWIWDSSFSSNSWVNFRKKIHTDKPVERATAYISVESRYWLYINGVNVVFDGSLKRGVNLYDGYYDEVDLTPYIVKGDNTIAVLAWYWDVEQNCFSAQTTERPGLIFEADVDGMTVTSDSSWKVKRNAAYIDDSGTVEGIKETQPSDVIAESNVYYDARKAENENWILPDFDDSHWENAIEIGRVPCKPWNELHKRSIPLFKDYGLKDYVNSYKYKDYTTKTDEVLRLDTEYNCQLTPYIELETDIPGLKIDMRSNSYKNGQGPTTTYSVKNVYVTKKGRQSFEGLAWIPGEHIYYTVPAGITIKALKYRESGYDSDFTGSFVCNDEFFNKLWKMSARTLYITMRDNFMDCPDRERAQWWGDVTIEIMMLMYALDTRSYDLYEKAWYNKIGVADSAKDGILRTLVPTGGCLMELPAQEMAGICGLWQYYLYTGNKELIGDVYPYVKNYLMKWDFDEEGSLIRRNGSWQWYDWGDKIDEEPLESIWYYHSLQTAIKLAEETGNTDDIPELSRRKNAVLSAIQTYITDSGIKSSNVEEPDDRCSAMAVIADIKFDNSDKIMRDVFNSVYNSSPYMEKYVLDAMCKVSSMKDVQKRIKLRYHDMVEGELACTTLWEHWDYNLGTKNHAWTGGPLITMSKYMAGVRPTKPGYDEFEVAPDMGELCFIKAVIPSVKGDIKVECNKNDSQKAFELCIEFDFDAKANVIIPCDDVSGQKSEISINGKAVDVASDERLMFLKDGKCCFAVGRGKWNFSRKLLPTDKV